MDFNSNPEKLKCLQGSSVWRPGRKNSPDFSIFSSEVEVLIG